MVEKTVKSSSITIMRVDVGDALKMHADLQQCTVIVQETVEANFAVLKACTTMP